MRKCKKKPKSNCVYTYETLTMLLLCLKKPVDDIHNRFVFLQLRQIFK